MGYIEFLPGGEVPSSTQHPKALCCGRNFWGKDTKYVQGMLQEKFRPTLYFTFGGGLTPHMPTPTLRRRELWLFYASLLACWALTPHRWRDWKLDLLFSKDVNMCSISREKNRDRIWPGEGSTAQWKWSLPAPGSLKTLLFPSHIKQCIQIQVRRGTSSIHFHCPVPRSSSHTGHGKNSHYSAAPRVICDLLHVCGSQDAAEAQNWPIDKLLILRGGRRG